MTSRFEPLVSVVTPVYNGAEFLRDCIESILAQSYSNWDYTIVNNCSTDGTLEIAREYAAMDPRIRIHDNTTFVRVIANHNIAFQQVSPESKYCKVVAADDWLFPECLEQMVRVAEEHPSVAIVGAYGLNGSTVEWAGILPYPSTVVRGRDACRARLLGGRSYFGTPSSVLYRSDVVRSRPTFYNESNLHADTEACFEVLEHHDWGFVHQVLTYRREHHGSLSSMSRDLNTYLPNKLAELVDYGERYLSEEEFRRRIREHLGVYYDFLGNQVFHLRDRQFWNFHKGKLGQLGYPLSFLRLAGHAIGFAFDRLLNPKSSIELGIEGLMARGSRRTRESKPSLSAVDRASPPRSEPVSRPN